MLNAFALCARCLRHVGKVMLLVVAALVGGIYVAVVANFPGLHSGAGAVRAAASLGLAAYTLLVAMLLWCYLATFATDPGHVPPGWYPFGDEEVHCEVPLSP